MKKIIVGNIKMNILTVSERGSYLKSFTEEISRVDLKETRVIVCPPFVHLEAFVGAFKDKKVEVGSQNAHWEERGAFTGEISAKMISSLGATYAIVGHSERRQYFGETDESVNLKIKAILKEKMEPIFCFGESLSERSQGITRDIIFKQIKEGLKDISAENISKIVFAYEPIWAIGSGMIPSSNDIMEVRILAKKIIHDTYGEEIAEKMTVLYGGSVNAENIIEVCVESGMDGVLVGGESLVPSKLINLAKILSA